jgi:putative membrane protein
MNGEPTQPAPEREMERHAARGGPFDEAHDATRRTSLANERTLLAWWRTGLAAFVVSLGAGRLVPELTKEPRWPYAVIGVGFALLGVAFVAYGFMRQRKVDDALARGEFAQPDERLLALLAGAGAVLGVAILVIVIVD